ncbi:hypothetical protein H4582DRAFT_364641, partial [Lactarius indigo]
LASGATRLLTEDDKILSGLEENLTHNSYPGVKTGPSVWSTLYDESSSLSAHFGKIASAQARRGRNGGPHQGPHTCCKVVDRLLLGLCRLRHALWFMNTGHTLALRPTTEQDNKLRTRIRASMSCSSSAHYPLYLHRQPVQSQLVVITVPLPSLTNMLLLTDSPSNLLRSPKSSSSSITQSRLTTHGNVRAEAGNSRQATTIDILPDDVLLEIFYLCRMNESGRLIYLTWKWHRLAQVCRRWRYIIFASPRHLDLKLLFTYGKPVWENLGYDSAFPIDIDYGSTCIHNVDRCPTPDDVQNITAAFAEPGRVRHINLNVTHLLSVLLAMIAVNEPFPVLEHLVLSSAESSVPAVKLPDGFLGGSAPSLQLFRSSGIPFPGLPRLLSSTNNLVYLRLDDIPPSGYISPQVMAAGLATLTRLEFFSIEFSSYRSAPTGDATLPETRIVLPALVSFEFAGNSKYLEHFVAQIDTPRLEFLGIMYFCQTGFQIPQLFQFIDRSTNFKRRLSLLADARILFDEDEAIFSIDGECESPVAPLDICVLCECEEIDCQVSRIALILSQSSALFSHIRHLSISCPCPPPRLEDVHSVQWLGLFCPFVAVQILRVDGYLIEDVALALGEVTAEIIPELLPALWCLDLGSDPKPYVDARKFILLRQLFGIPVTAVTLGDYSWETDGGLDSACRIREFDDVPGSDVDE